MPDTHPAAPEDAPILLVDYDPRWPSLFEQERDALAPLLAPWLAGPIEHIGSTAIPGLAAKPVIDIMAAVRSLEESRPAIHALEKSGYLHAPYNSEVEHWFCKPSPSFRTHHLHLIPHDSPEWLSCLQFRDLLRRDPHTAAQYLALKQSLASTFAHDREAYTAGKTDFITLALIS